MAQLPKLEQEVADAIIKVSATGCLGDIGDWYLANKETSTLKTFAQLLSTDYYKTEVYETGGYREWYEDGIHGSSPIYDKRIVLDKERKSKLAQIIYDNKGAPQNLKVAIANAMMFKEEDREQALTQVGNQFLNLPN